MTQIINRREPLEVAFFVVGGVCWVILLFFVGGLVLDVYTMNSEQQVSGPLALSSEWVEITPARPMRPLKRSQALVLEIDSGQGLIGDNLHPDVLRLADGTNVNPEIQLLDQYGNVFNAEIYRSPSPSRYGNAITGSVAGMSERSYVKLRLRSDKPLRLSRIVWHSWRGK